MFNMIGGLILVMSRLQAVVLRVWILGRRPSDRIAIRPDDHPSGWSFDRIAFRHSFHLTRCFTHCSSLILSFCNQDNFPTLPSIQDYVIHLTRYVFRMLCYASFCGIKLGESRNK
ncbi:hypothetical protein Hdeb2414_s0002g00073731 [Helianthus debilis subsp. tardiflorus]